MEGLNLDMFLKMAQMMKGKAAPQGPSRMDWHGRNYGSPDFSQRELTPEGLAHMDRHFYREAPDTGFRSNMPIEHITQEEMDRRDQERLAPLREQLMADPEMMERLRMMMDLMRSQ